MHRLGHHGLRRRARPLRDDAHRVLQPVRQFDRDGVARDRHGRSRLPAPTHDGAAGREGADQADNRLRRLEPKVLGNFLVRRRGAVLKSETANEIKDIELAPREPGQGLRSGLTIGPRRYHGQVAPPKRIKSFMNLECYISYGQIGFILSNIFARMTLDNNIYFWKIQATKFPLD